MAHAPLRRARSVRDNANCGTARSTTSLLSALLFAGMQFAVANGVAHHSTTSTNTSYLFHFAPPPADATLHGIVDNKPTFDPRAAGSNPAAQR